MNFKKILTGVVAGAMAVSAMAVSSFAKEPLQSPEDWSTPVELFNHDSLSTLENYDKLYDGELKVTYTIDVAAAHEWANGTVIVRPLSANDEYGWTEKKFGGSACEGQSWFAEDAYIIADDAESFTVTVNVDLSEAKGISVCAQAGAPGDGASSMFTLVSVSMENDAGFKAVYADGEVTVPSDPTPSETEAPAPDETEGPAPDVDEFTEVAISGNEKHDAPVLNVDGKVRLNIVHPWSQGEYVFADYKAFTGATVIKAEITVSGVTDAFNAQLMGSNNSDPVSFSIWGDSETDVGTSDVVTIDKDGKYVLTLTSPEAIVESENFFLMINTTLDGVKNGDDSVPPEGLTVTLDKLSVNVKQTDEPVGTGSEGTEPDVTDPEETLVADGTETEGTDAEATTSGVAGNTNNGGNDKGDNKPTGIVFAVIPAVAAAAAVVISKKRK